MASLPTTKRLPQNRSALVTLTAVASLVVCAVALAYVQVASDATNTLKPLPPGPSEIKGHAPSMEAISRTDLISSRPTAVFTGRVIGKGGSEPIGGSDPRETGGFQLTAHRVRVAIDRVIRGEQTSTVDLVILDLEGLDTFEIGATYLVFAESREVGDGRVSGLLPMGYYQGAFRLTGDDRAVNEKTSVSFRLTELAAELEKGR